MLGHIWIIDKDNSEELVDKGYQDVLELLKK